MPTIIPSTTVGQEYTIGNGVSTYTVTPFTTVPPQCASNLVYSFNAFDDSTPIVIGSQGAAASLQAGTTTFEFEYNGSLDLAGNLPGGKDYLLTLNAQLTSLNGNMITNSANFNLKIKAPCYDPQFLQVAPA